MDPKSTTLDPKLKEVYDRVMGTAAGAPASPATTPMAANTPPQASPTAPQPAPTPPSTPAMPAQPPALGGSAFPPPKSSLDSSSAPKSAVDYAALAAKYATPAPALSENPSGGGFVPPAPTSSSPAGVGAAPLSPTHADSAQQATNAATHETPAAHPKADPNVATFSATVQVPANSGVAATKNSSSLLKIGLFVGIPLFLIAYTVVWVVVFKVDLMKFIPGA